MPIVHVTMEPLWLNGKWLPFARAVTEFHKFQRKGREIFMYIMGNKSTYHEVCFGIQVILATFDATSTCQPRALVRCATVEVGVALKRASKRKESEQLKARRKNGHSSSNAQREGML